jgi:hypothetical protein
MSSPKCAIKSLSPAIASPGAEDLKEVPARHKRTKRIPLKPGFAGLAYEPPANVPLHRGFSTVSLPAAPVTPALP